MEQLLLHLFGDYVSQTDWMAREKTKKTWAAFCHATIYSLPFLFLTTSPMALFVIWSSHLLIDRFGLARHVVFAKNWSTNQSLKWKDCAATGYPVDVPVWMSVWLLIIADNTLHLLINYGSLRWL